MAKPPEKVGKKGKGGGAGSGPRAKQSDPKRFGATWLGKGRAAENAGNGLLSVGASSPATARVFAQNAAEAKANASPVGKATNSKASRSAAVKKAWLKRRRGGK